MYNDLFVAPKQRELEKLKKKEDDGKEQLVTAKNIVQRARVEGHIEEIQQVKKAIKRIDGEKVITLEDGGESIIKELKASESETPQLKAINHEQEIDVIEVIMNKYNSSSKQ